MVAIKKRFNILKTLIKIFAVSSPAFSNFAILSGVASVIQLYGIRKFFLRNSMIVEQLEEKDFVCVNIHHRLIYWPSMAQVSRLVDMYFEVFQRNNHQFITRDTPLLRGDIVVDAGCCEGYFAKLALELGASKVYCFEPGKMIGACIEKTFCQEIQNNQLELVPMLLGDRNCNLSFIEDPVDPTIGQIISYDSTSGEENIYPVTMTSLDLFLARRNIERIDFLKVDVEGAEPKVIEGAKEIIMKFAPRIAIAVYHAPDHAHLLQELIYSVNSSYRFHLKGLVDLNGIVRPVMLHCHVPS